MSKFITDHGQGHIVAQIGGKQVPIRQTVHQMERFAAFTEAEKGKAEAPADEPLGGRFRRLFDEQLSVAEIVLNPEPNKTDWAREAIEKALDVDQVKFLVDVWMQKVFSPKLAADPRLAPEKTGANG